jgi:2-polyprenyl-3-methyl-5-hydroxy-6-metoxy-1,4-benzoquinol methylase
MQQPPQTKGGIVIDDGVWLGFGVIVLDGVRIGKGAVIGAGAVVTHDIPDGAIAVGNPAQVIKMRNDIRLREGKGDAGFAMDVPVFRPDQKPKGYFTNERNEMLRYIPLTSKRILDVGCGSGNFGKLMKSQMNVEVWGVEICENAAKESVNNIDRIIVGNIEKGDLGLPLNYFDCIVFNDVLEHLCDPWNVLVRCKAFLHEAGYIVVSIPNIRYYPHIRSLLVSKNWEYKDEGILDRTHLRFFTERSIREMFLHCGYQIIQLEGINRCKFSRKLQILNFFLRNSLEDMRYLQFAVVAQKKENS